MSEYTLYTKRIGLVASTHIITVLRSLIILPIFTKTLGASDYGVWAQILVTISLLQPIIHLGLENALIRFFSSKTKTEISQGIFTVSSITLITGMVASFILFFSAGFISNSLLHEPSATSVIRLATPLLLLEVLNNIALGSFRIFGQIKRYTIIIWLRNALEIGLITYFVLSGYGLTGAIVSLVITRGITLIIMLYLIISHAGIVRPDYSNLRAYLAYGLPLVPMLFFQFVVSASDRYVIGFFNDAASVGIYSAAYGIGSVIVIFSAYIMYILRPTIYEKYDENKIGEVKTYLSYSWKYLLTLAIPAIFGISILSKQLLVNFTTIEFLSEGQIIIPLIASAIGFYSIEQIFGAVLLLSKRSKIYLIVFGIAAVINLCLNFLLIPYLGITGAAIATLAAYFIAAVFIYYQSRKVLIFDLNLIFIGKCILASSIMTLVVYAINPESIMFLALTIIIGIAIYFVILLLLRGFKKNELRFFRQLFWNFSNKSRDGINKFD